MERTMTKKLRLVAIIMLSIITFVVIAPGPAMGVVIGVRYVWDGLLSIAAWIMGWLT